MTSTSLGLTRGCRALATIACAVLSACTNLATLQEPETMPEGDFELAVGGTFTHYELEITSTTSDGTGATVETVDREQFSVPAVMLSGRYGVRERLEVHGNIWLPFGASIGGKYMLVGDREHGGFAFSPGLDLSMPLTISIGDTSGVLFDAVVPLHMGYRTSPNLAIYWTPKYALRVWGTELGHIVGGNLGIDLGHDTQFLFEGGAFYDTITEAPVLTGGFAVGFR